MKAKKIHFEGSDFWISADDISPDLRLALMECGKSGDSEEAVRYVRENYEISGNEADCRAYLKGFGAWEDADLEDHDRNLDRLVWLTGCDLKEQNEAYFAVYG